MNRTIVGVFMAFLLALPGAQMARGQRGRMMMGGYDTQTEITLKGTIEKVGQPNASNMMMGANTNMMTGMRMVYLTLKTDNETVQVHLGPAGFIEKTPTLKEGDTIEVAGAKVMMMGTEVVLAREVRKDGAILKLRDEHGAPLWPAGPGHMGRPF
jgi:hypothetical protein